MIKLIASDMDGTLLNSKHDIDIETVEAIRKAEKNGLIFAISTGREYENVRPFLEKHDIKCQCVLMNGAEYRDEEGKILKVINIELDKSKKIIDILHKEKISARIFTNKGLFTSDTEEEALKEMAYRTLAFNPEMSMEEATECAKGQPYFKQLQYIENMDEFLNGDIEIRKFVAFHNDLEKIARAKEIISKIDNLAVSSSFVDNIEITDKEAQKGIILAKVAGTMGINKNEVAVLGDSFNDYSMFTEFENGIAMENAIPEIKEAAKYITDTNDNYGVAKAIHKIINGEIK